VYSSLAYRSGTVNAVIFHILISD